MIDAGFLKQWISKGHTFGECMSHPDTNLMYIYIPKNATSWTKPNLQDWNWEVYNYHTDTVVKNKQAMVVLRDPLERWISGIAEYLYLHHYDVNPWEFTTHMINLIFDRVCFDDHTEKQISFLHGIERKNCIFFKCDENYRLNFSDFLNTQGMSNQYFKYDLQHVSADSKLRNDFKNLFKQQIEKHSRYREAIEWYFDDDYNLINSVKFYGTR